MLHNGPCTLLARGSETERGPEGPQEISRDQLLCFG